MGSLCCSPARVILLAHFGLSILGFVMTGVEIRRGKIKETNAK